MKKILIFLFLFAGFHDSFSQSSVALNAPIGGENYTAGSTQFIIYTTTNISQLAIRFSPNNGLTWSTVAIQNVSDGPGFYSWSVPMISTSNTCLIKTVDLQDTLVTDVSSNFTITGPVLTCVGPSSGTTLTGGGTGIISWSSQNLSGSAAVKIELNTGDTSWSTIVASTPNDDSLSWAVPLINSTNCRIRISLVGSPQIFCTTSVFSIQQPASYTITVPNGGEFYQAGNSMLIQWISGNNLFPVFLEYSTDGGLTYSNLVSNITNTNSYLWTIPPQINSVACRIRIFDPNGYMDESDANFTISPVFPSCILDYSPTNAAVNVPTTTTLGFFSNETGIIGYNIYFGTSPNPPLVAANYNTNSYNPGALSPGTTYYWKILPINSIGTAAGCDTWSFTTSGNANSYLMSDTITVTNCSGNFFDSGGPNANYQPGESFSKNFFPSVAGQAVQMNFSQFSLTLGSGSLTLFDGTSTNAPIIGVFTGSLAPGTITAGNPSGAIKAVFSSGSGQSAGWAAQIACVAQNDAIFLLSPDGGNALTAGTTYNIEWTYQNVYAINISYSIDGGVNYTPIVSNYSVQNGVNSYAWNVPFTLSSNCKVKIENAADPSVFDVSSSAFFIVSGSSTIALLFPNGGQTVSAGGNLEIIYEQSGTSVVNISYSTNGGLSYTPIINNQIFIGAQANYIWTVPNTPSNQCLIKVQNALDTNVFDVSDAYFTITGTNQSVLLNAPNGGENYQVGTGIYINWIQNSVFPVDIFYSYDGGFNYDLIVSNYNSASTTGSFYWIVPNTPAFSCLMKIQSSNNAAIFDLSDAAFTISTAPSTMAVNYPNGGETLNAGSSVTLQWGQSSQGQVQLSYSINGGASYLPIVASYSATAGSNFYQWTVPTTPSNNCKFKVQSLMDTSVNDASNGLFSIVTASPSINLQYPDGGQSFVPGQNVEILWQSSNINNLKLYYSTDAGNTWSLIASNVNANDGFYIWTVPNVSSTQCRVKVTDGNNAQTFDASSFNFTIQQSQPSLTLLYPNGGEGLATGSTVYISWSASNVANIKIEYSNNGGTSWNLITNSIPAANNYYAWTVPNTPSANCKIRISDAGNNAVSDQSNGTFVISSPSITLNTPNGGESYVGGNYANITWNASATSSLASLYFSQNAGITWNQIADVNSSQGINTYQWLIPNISSSQCRIKVADYYNSSVQDFSNANFNIQEAPPSISLNYPNGGEVFVAGSQAYISWYSLSINSLKIEFSANGGTSWNLLESSFPAAQGYYLWNVPNLPSLNCKVRVSSAGNANVSDVSNASFSIVLPSITLTAPNGGESISGFGNTQITWTASQLPGSYVDLEYTINNGLSWTYIVSGIYNGGSYSWQVPNTPSSQCRVRVSCYGFNNIQDISNNVFTITAAASSIMVISPNGGEVFGAGSSEYIQWDSQNISAVTIDYSTDGGNNFTQVATNVPNYGYYLWTIPSTVSTQCKIKVSDASNLSTSDVSNDLFSILNPGISLVDPNGGEIYTGNSTATASYVASGISNYLNLELSTDSMSSWSALATGMYNMGAAEWQVPNLSSNRCFLRISDFFNANISDTSNARFSIIPASPSITLYAPNGGETFASGQETSIFWSATSIAQIKIEFSSDGGTSYTTIASAVDATMGFYSWNVPGTPSSNCRIRISDAANNSLSDASLNTFSIVAPFIEVLYPNGGEEFISGQGYYLQWSSIGIDNVKIEFSLNAGSTWTMIENSISNTGYYYWIVPQISSNLCRIRVTKAGALIPSDASNADFSISIPSPQIFVFEPQQGQEYYTGSSIYISWFATSVNAVNIDLSINGGSTWSNLVSNVPANNGYIFTSLPSTQTENALVRVRSESDSLVVGFSDIFSIVTPTPAINLIQPNGGQVLQSGSLYPIVWSAANLDCFRLSFSSDNGNTWNLIADNLIQDIYYWGVPPVVSSSCLIKVESCFGQFSAISASVFSIGPPVANNNTLAIDSLLQHVICKGDSLHIYYTASGNYAANNYFIVEISDGSGSFSNPLVIGSALSQDLNGLLSVQVPFTLSNGSNYRVRIRSTELPSVSSPNNQSIVIRGAEADFFITNPAEVYYLPQNGVVNFSASSSTGGIDTWFWEFGDGSTGFGQEVTHVYNDIVYFTVSLTVQDSSGCSFTRTYPNMVHTEYYLNNDVVFDADSASITSVSFVDAFKGCYTLSNGKCYVTSDGGNSWSESQTGLSAQTSLMGASLNQGAWFVTGANGTMLRSNNQGTTWETQLLGTNETILASDFTTPTNGLAVGTNGTMLKYNGSNWTNVNADNSLGSSHMRAVAFADTNTAVAVGDNGTINRLFNGNWQTIVNTDTNTYTSVSFSDSVTGFITTSDGRMLRTSNAGETWNVAMPPAGAMLRCVSAEDGFVCAVGDHGLAFVSEDNGNTFARYGVGSTETLYGVKARRRRGYIGGNGGTGRAFGALPDTSGGTSIREIGMHQTSVMTLQPNPAREVITLSGECLANETYTIEIVDARGGALIEQSFQQSATKYKVMLDISKLSAGIYFVRLIGKEVTITKRLSVVK
ncbi:MAG: PKD domain-containing protein [Bacteroidota bacterium]